MGYDVLGKNKPELKTPLIKIPCYFMIGENDDVV